MTRLFAAAVVVLFVALPAPAEVRIKDITDVAGARSNQLFGFGLVVGLDQTGRDLQEHRFAGTVAPDQADAFFGRHR